MYYSATTATSSRNSVEVLIAGQAITRPRQRKGRYPSLRSIASAAMDIFANRLESRLRYDWAGRQPQMKIEMDPDRATWSNYNADVSTSTSARNH